MFFILLTFSAALFIEGLGSLVSVIGISALFGANPIIIALAISLDVGKVVVVSLLYTHWKQLSFLMKTYALIAAAVTMTITSAGAAGYLSGEFQKAIIGTKEGELKVSVLKEQQLKYEQRKKQIDDQIANLPQRTTVNQRQRLMSGFKAEKEAIDKKISEIDKQLPDAQLKQIGTETKAGPILYIAKAFNVTVEEAVKYVILLIIFVFDPLAIFLIIAGNFLWARRKEEKREAHLNQGREEVSSVQEKRYGEEEPEELQQVDTYVTAVIPEYHQAKVQAVVGGDTYAITEKTAGVNWAELVVGQRVRCWVEPSSKVARAELIRVTPPAGVYEDWSPTIEEVQSNIEANKEFYEELASQADIKKPEPSAFDQLGDRNEDFNTYYIKEDGTIVRPEMPEELRGRGAETAEQFNHFGPFDPADDALAREPYLPVLTPEQTALPVQPAPFPSGEGGLLSTVNAESSHLDEFPAPPNSVSPTSFDDVAEDPTTIVDANTGYADGFARAKSLIPPKK